MDFQNLTKLLVGTYYAVPDYQRDYEWTNAQNSTLSDDIFYLMTNDNKNNRHFLGAIVTIPFENDNSTNKSIELEDYQISEDNVKHIVDGQQRLTSLCIMCKVIYELIKEDESIPDDSKQNLYRKLDLVFLGTNYHKNKTDAAAPTLILNGNTGNCFNNEVLKVSTEKYNGKYKGARRIKAAYDFFKKDLSEKRNDFISDSTFKNTLDFYKELIKTVTEKIVLVEIECDASDDAFQVFDSLNGKGLDLTAADRIKNIIMSWSPSDKRAQNWNAIADKIEENYLGNFFVCLFFYEIEKRVQKNKLPDEFGKQYRNSALTNFEDFYNKLFKKVEMYSILRNKETGNSETNELLRDIDQLGFEQVYVMLFSVLINYGDTILKSDEYKELARALVRLAVRYQITDRSYNKFDSLFSKYIKAMKNNQVSLKEIVNNINKDINENVSDKEFEESFANFCTSDNNVSEYYLRSIENHLQKIKNKNRNVFNRKGTTVEHIIPKAADLSMWYRGEQVPPEYLDDPSSLVQNIGNKALLYLDDNSSANAKMYDEKQVLYKNGIKGKENGTPNNTFVMIKELLNDYPDKFNHEQVLKRAAYLATIAVKIW